MSAEPPGLKPITPDQVRAARSLLGWSRERLAAHSGVTTIFVSTYEDTGRVMKMWSRVPSVDGLAAVRGTLEASGVEFTTGDQPGVKLAKVVD